MKNQEKIIDLLTEVKQSVEAVNANKRVVEKSLKDIGDIIVPNKRIQWLKPASTIEELNQLAGHPMLVSVLYCILML